MMIVPCPACATAMVGYAAREPANAAIKARDTVGLFMTRPFNNQYQRASTARGSSYALGQADSYPAAGTDRRSQQRVAKGLGRARLSCRIPMLQLFGLELGDIAGEFGVFVAELAQLFRIMFVDLGLDRIGAGERCFLRHQRGRRA